jgi:hypothetical protein
MLRHTGAVGWLEPARLWWERLALTLSRWWPEHGGVHCASIIEHAAHYLLDNLGVSGSEEAGVVLLCLLGSSAVLWCVVDCRVGAEPLKTTMSRAGRAKPESVFIFYRKLKALFSIFKNNFSLIGVSVRPNIGRDIIA